MADITGTIVYIINSYVTWIVAIIGGAIIVLTEISKLTRFTKSTVDDLIVMQILKELKEWKNKLLGFIKK